MKKPKAKKTETTWDEKPVWWIPGQGLVRATENVTRFDPEGKSGKYFIGEATDKAWWLIFDEYRKVWCDGWSTEEAALSWAKTSLADAVRGASLRGRPPELPTDVSSLPVAEAAAVL